LKFGGNFEDELDAGKRVNQLCEELGISLQNPEISAIPNEQLYQKRERTSQYKGVYWHRKVKMWYARVSLKGYKQKYAGIFNDEQDAAKRVNQLCEELGIPPQNPGVVEMSTQVSPHDGENTIATSVISTEILNTENDLANKTKRKRDKELSDDDRLPVERYYFYDHLLN